MREMPKPRVFVGSSQEGRGIASVVTKVLNKYAEATLWQYRIFELGASALESLEQATNHFDFAVFVLTPDDITISRGIEKPAPRDNLIFEFGLFVSKLGRKRVFLYVPSGADIKLPSDLLGITEIMYDDRRSDGNMEASIDIASTDLIRLLQHAQLLSGRFKQKNVYMSLRKELEKDYPWEERIGAIDEESSIEEIRILNFAATTILAPDYCDPFAAPSSGMSKRIRELIGKGTTVDIIINAPTPHVAADSIQKIQNRTVGEDPAQVFLVSYFGLMDSIEKDEVYNRAYYPIPPGHRTLNYHLTEICLPYAIFHVMHKPGYEYLNHVKVDLYPEQLRAEGERPSMVIYETEDSEMYSFFAQNFLSIRNNSCMSHKTESEQQASWRAQWNKIQGERGNG